MQIRNLLRKLMFVTPWLIIVGGVVDRLRRQNTNDATPLVVSEAIPDEVPVDPQRSPKPERVAQVAVEVWRLGRRLDQSSDLSRIRESYARIGRALEDAGIRIDDPINQTYIDGTRAEIITAPENVDFDREDLFVSDVLRPSVFVHDVCVVQPQVVLGRTSKSEGESE